MYIFPLYSPCVAPLVKSLISEPMALYSEPGMQLSHWATLGCEYIVHWIDKYSCRRQSWYTIKSDHCSRPVSFRSSSFGRINWHQMTEQIWSRRCAHSFRLLVRDLKKKFNSDSECKYRWWWWMPPARFHMSRRPTDCVSPSSPPVPDNIIVSAHRSNEIKKRQ